MAEETNELEKTSGSDAISTAAGAREDELAARAFDDPAFDTPDDTEQIKARIEETRNQMGETIDAIQERLSFANISEQVSETVSNAIETAKDTAYDATIGKAVNIMRNVGDGVSQTGAFKTVKKNPLPFALIGIGAGLLAYQGFSYRGGARRGNGRTFADRDQSGYRGEDSRFSSARHAVGSAAERAYHGVTDKANTALETVSSAAGSAYESVTGAVGGAYSNAGELANRAYERAGEYGTLAHDKYDEYLEENPLALGAVALAVGAAVGFAIPATRYEGQLMGEARDNLMLRAQDAAGSLVEKAKEAVNEGAKTVTSELGH